MKTWKPTLEVLEGRAMMSGLWDPGPGGGTPVPTGPLGVPILAGKGGTGDINFETPGGAVMVGNEVVFLTQDHWDRGGFEDLEQDPPEGVILVDTTPDDTPEPPPRGGGGGILGWLGGLFGGGKNKESTDSGQDVPAVNFTPSENTVALFAPPEVDVPGPKPDSEWNTLVRPPSQPQSLSDIVSQAVANDESGITLTPGGTSSQFVAKSSNLVTPSAFGADWQPVTNIFQGQPGRATGGDTGTAFSINFRDIKVDVVARMPTDPVSFPDGDSGLATPGVINWVKSPRDAATPVGVSVPDGGTVLLGGVKSAGQAHETVSKNETITIGSVAVDALLAGTYGRGGANTAHDWASQVDTFFGQVGLQEKPSKGIIANGLEILGARTPAGASMTDGSVRGIQANPQNGIIAVLIGG